MQRFGVYLRGFYTRNARAFGRSSCRHRESRSFRSSLWRKACRNPPTTVCLFSLTTATADDRINLTNISLQGVVEPFSETDGFITRSINTGDTPFQGETFGPCIVASDGISFKDATGKRLNGKLTFCVEIYNSTASDKVFHNGVKPKPAADGWDAWCKIYTNWSASKAAASSWTTMKFTYDTSANTICMGRNAWDYNGSHIRSVYVYYAPTVSYAGKAGRNNRLLQTHLF